MAASSGKTITRFTTMTGTYDLDCLTGQVLDTGTRSVTTVSGGANAPVSSTTTTYTRIFLLDAEGKEHAVNLQDFEVVCRPGNVLSVLSAIRHGKPLGWAIAAYNHDTRETTWRTDRLRIIHGRRRIWHICAHGLGLLGLLKGYGWNGLVGALGLGMVMWCIGAIVGAIAGNITSGKAVAAFKTGPAMQAAREALVKVDL